MSLKNSVFNVDAKPFSKSIRVPSSKSYSNRALVIGARTGNEFTIFNLSNSTDVKNFLKVLTILGVKFTHSEDVVVFHNSFPECEVESSSPILLETGDGGTTNRFLVPLLALGKNDYHLIPSEKMSDRPMSEIISPLEKLGVKIELNKDNVWLKVKGPAKFDLTQLEVDCTKSTQFASGLMLAFFDKKIKYNFLKLNSSIDYLKMTETVISTSLKSNSVTVPVDFSSLSYPAVLAALLGSVHVVNCHELDEYQADSFLFKIFSQIGIDYDFKDGIKIISSKVKNGFVCDGNKCPDLIMTLVALASKIPYKSEFKNLDILRYKESDRLKGILDILQLFNVDFLFDEQNNQLIIFGDVRKQDKIDLMVERDHRMVMMGYLMLRLNSGGSINNMDCVQKSYENFFDLD